MTTEQLDQDIADICSIAARAIRLAHGSDIPPGVAAAVPLADCEAHNAAREAIISDLTAKVAGDTADASAAKQSVVQVWARAFEIAEAAVSTDHKSSEFSQFKLRCRDGLRAAKDDGAWRIVS